MDPNNPYDAPQAALQNAQATDDSDFLHEPQEVPAGNAIEWFATGWNWVMQAPGTWIALFLLMIVAIAVLSCVPFATNLLMPVITAGIAIGCERQRRGEELTVDCLFDGFRSPHVMQLILVGVFTMVGTLLAMLVVFPIMIGVTAVTGPMAEQNDAAGFLMIAVMFVLMLAVIVPLSMATYFSPLLVVFHGLPALDAMLLSLRAGMRNIGAIVVYVLVTLLVVILASLPLFLGFLIAVPLFMATQYAAYRDIFYAR